MKAWEKFLCCTGDSHGTREKNMWSAFSNAGSGFVWFVSRISVSWIGKRCWVIYCVGCAEHPRLCPMVQPGTTSWRCERRRSWGQGQLCPETWRFFRGLILLVTAMKKTANRLVGRYGLAVVRVTCWSRWLLERGFCPFKGR